MPNDSEHPDDVHIDLRSEPREDWIQVGRERAENGGNSILFHEVHQEGEFESVVQAGFGDQIVAAFLRDYPDPRQVFSKKALEQLGDAAFSTIHEDNFNALVEETSNELRERDVSGLDFFERRRRSVGEALYDQHKPIITHTAGVPAEAYEQEYVDSFVDERLMPRPEWIPAEVDVAGVVSELFETNVIHWIEVHWSVTNELLEEGFFGDGLAERRRHDVVDAIDSKIGEEELREQLASISPDIVPKEIEMNARSLVAAVSSAVNEGATEQVESALDQLQTVYLEYDVPVVRRAFARALVQAAPTSEQLMSGEIARHRIEQLAELASEYPTEIFSEDVSMALALYAESLQDEPGVAKRSLERVLEADPTNATAHVSLARLLAEEDEYSEVAVEHLRQAIENDPTHIEAHHLLASLLYSMEPTEALRIYERIIDMEPSDPRAHGYAAHLLITQFSDLDLPEAHFEQTVLDQLDDHFSLDLLRDQVSQLHLARAIEYFTEAIKLWIESDEIANAITDIFLVVSLSENLGYPEVAIDYCELGFELAEQLDDSNAEEVGRHLRIAYALLSGRDQSDAVRELYSLGLNTVNHPDEAITLALFSSAWGKRGQFEPTSPAALISNAAGVALVVYSEVSEIEIDHNWVLEKIDRENLTEPASVLLNQFESGTAEADPDQLDLLEENDDIRYDSHIWEAEIEAFSAMLHEFAESNDEPSWSAESEG